MGQPPLRLLRFQVFEPEVTICFFEVSSLIAVIAVHSVRVYHEIELLSGTMQLIKKLESVLVMNIVIACAMGQLKHHRLHKTIASLMTDGCNMGVKSLNKYLNKYKAADEVSKDIAKRLINLEEKLAIDIRQFL